MMLCNRNWWLNLLIQDLVLDWLDLFSGFENNSKILFFGEIMSSAGEIGFHFFGLVNKEL